MFKSFLATRPLVKAPSQPELRDHQFLAPCWADDDSEYVSDSVSDTTVSGDLGSPHEETFSLDFNYHCAPPQLAPPPSHVRSPRFLSRTPSYFACHRRTNSSPIGSASYAEFDLFEDGDMLTPFTHEALEAVLAPVPEHEPPVLPPVAIPEVVIDESFLPQTPHRTSSLQDLHPKPAVQLVSLGAKPKRGSKIRKMIKSILF